MGEVFLDHTKVAEELRHIRSKLEKAVHRLETVHRLLTFVAIELRCDQRCSRCWFVGGEHAQDCDRKTL